MCQRFKVAGCTVEAVRSRDLNAVAAVAAAPAARRLSTLDGLIHFLGALPRHTYRPQHYTLVKMWANYSDFQLLLTLKTGMTLE